MDGDGDPEYMAVDNDICPAPLLEVEEYTRPSPRPCTPGSAPPGRIIGWPSPTRPCATARLADVSGGGLCVPVLLIEVKLGQHGLHVFDLVHHASNLTRPGPLHVRVGGVQDGDYAPRPLRRVAVVHRALPEPAVVPLDAGQEGPHDMVLLA